jgi:hypothetical protein
MPSRIRTLANIYSPARGSIDDIGAKIEVYSSVNTLPLSGNTTGDRAFCQDVNRLYFWNGSGWYSYSLVNETPIISVDVDNTEIDGLDGTPLVVTATASDPEGFSLTYSYEVTAGTLGGTTISQVGNVFTITPSSDSNDAGDITIAFKASDGINTAVVNRTFTIQFLPTLTEFMDTRNPLHLVEVGSVTSGTVFPDYYNSASWNSSSGSVGTVAGDTYPAGNYIDLETSYMELTTGSQTVGQNYTHFYMWRPRISDTNWRTLFRNSSHHLVIVNSGAKDLGMYANSAGNFRDTGYDITTDWQTLIVIGQGASANTTSGTQTFYVNGVNVGTTDRVASGTTTYRIGWVGSPNQSPGLINCAGMINTAISGSDINTLHQILVARMTP